MKTWKTNWVDGETVHSADMNRLEGNGKANEEAIANMVVAVGAKADENHTHSLESVTETNNKKIMTAAERTKLSGIADGANKYTHPSHTAATSGLYKVTVDASGHVTAATPVQKSDITALGIPGQDTNTTYGVATTSQSGLMSASDKSKLNKVPGQIVAGDTYTINSVSYTAGNYAERFNSSTNKAIGVNSHAEGNYSTASGDTSHAEGGSCTASGVTSHAEGETTTASGDHSHAEGEKTIASGECSHAGGYSSEARGKCSFAFGNSSVAYAQDGCALGHDVEAGQNQFACGKFSHYHEGPVDSDQTYAKSLFVVGNGTASAATKRSTAFIVTASGACINSSGTYTKNADFAEYFEWEDCNPHNEDRRGRFVTLVGDKIRLANSDDNYILGIVSSTAAVIGNAASLDWHKKYLTDVFGSRIYQEIEVPEFVDEKTGEITPAHTVKQWVINPDYDEEFEYVGRESRKEWSPIGMLGQIVAVDDGTCQVNGYCAPSAAGVATASESGYRVMKRIDESHIKVLVR